MNAIPRSWLAAAGVVLLLVAVLQLVDRSRPGPSNVTEAIAADVNVTAGIASTEAVVMPVATGDRTPPPTEPLTERSSRGAIRAAVHMLEMGETALTLSADEAAQLQASIAASASRERLQYETAGRVQTFHDDLGDGSDVALHVAAVSAHATEVDAGGERASVRLWYVGVFTRSGQVPMSFWRTITYDLIWEAGSWRELASESAAGPTPALSSLTLIADAGELATTLAEFDDAGLMP